MKTQSIIDAGDLRKYFTQIPNMVDDAGLTVYEFRLYAHLKRVAGDRGRCWQGTETLAASCNMSGGSISKAKHGLKEKGLISIEKKTDSRKMYHEITVIDVWPQNFAKYSLSPDVLGRSRDERHPSPGERKKNLVKEELLTNEHEKNSFTTYEEEIGPLTSHIANRLGSLVDDYTEAWTIDAIKLASENNARNIKYIETVLSNWHNKGRDWKPGKKNSKPQTEEYFVEEYR